jgi:hypothetical protein
MATTASQSSLPSAAGAPPVDEELEQLHDGHRAAGPMCGKSLAVTDLDRQVAGRGVEVGIEEIEARFMIAMARGEIGPKGDVIVREGGTRGHR